MRASTPGRSPQPHGNIFVTKLGVQDFSSGDVAIDLTYYLSKTEMLLIGGPFASKRIAVTPIIE